MTDKSIVGTWQLQAFEYQAEDGSRIYPMGPDAFGYITYTDAGYMCAAIQEGGRENFKIPHRLDGTPEEKVKAADSFMSYCGRYRVEEGKVVHVVEISSFPNWVGGEQERKIEWQEDGGLNLTTPPMMIGGKPHTVHVKWKRA